MSFQGDIRSISLGDVIQNLTANQQTGILSIQSGDAKFEIGFREGNIVSYADDQGFSPLEWLTEKEFIPEDVREDVRKRYARSKRKTLGEILSDLGVLEPEEYRQVLEDLVQDSIYEVLSLQQGTFQFHTRKPDEELEDREMRALSLAYNPMSLLMEAARRTDDWKKIRRHVPSENEIYVPSDTDVEHLFDETTDEVVREAVLLLDGTRTLRQVIAKLPYSRFDSCRAVAHLIAEKKIRPLEGDVLLQASDTDEDPEQVAMCLKAILEREPNNREVLQKLADLSERLKRRDESATYNKLLANSHLDDKNLQAAETFLRKALVLNLKDHTTWQKLWDLLQQEGDRSKIRLFGQQFVAHFKKLGLLEVARDRMQELIKLFPGETTLKVELADIHFQLGNRRGAIRSLTDLGNKLLKKNKLDEAESLFTRVLKYDRKNKKAREVVGEIRSGKLEERRARRRRIIHTTVTVALLFTLCLQLGYELHVHGKFFQATKTVFADGLLEEGRYQEAIQRVEAVRKKYPFSLTALYKAPPLVKALEEGMARSGKTHTFQPPANGKRRAARQPPANAP